MILIVLKNISDANEMKYFPRILFNMKTTQCSRAIYIDPKAFHPY